MCVCMFEGVLGGGNREVGHIRYLPIIEMRFLGSVISINRSEKKE